MARTSPEDILLEKCPFCLKNAQGRSRLSTHVEWGHSHFFEEWKLLRQQKGPCLGEPTYLPENSWWVALNGYPTNSPDDSWWSEYGRKPKQSSD